TFQTIWKESKILVYCLTAAVGGVAIGSGSWMAHSPAIAPVAAATATITPGSIETSFAPVVERAMPAVVNISSSKASKVSAEAMPFDNDSFFRQFFGQGFGGRDSRQPQNRARKQFERSLGSGVIVRS